MFAAPTEDRLHDGTSQIRDGTRPGSRAKKKNQTPMARVTSGPSLTLPPLCQDPPPFSATFVCKPLSGRTPIPTDTPLSVVELPRLLPQVGPKRAIGDTKWRDGPHLMASALGTDIPVRAADMLVEAQTAQRPYDLQVVHPSEAGSDHYIFSPSTVLHVTAQGYGGLLTLAEWHRESVLWTALRDIPFFRDYRMRKAFTCWHRNVRKIAFQRKCKKLQDLLLPAVPQFRQALFLFTRVIEEVKGIHWLPQDDSKTYTLLEFKNTLITKTQECLGIFEKLLHYRKVILNAVKEDSYKTHRELHLRAECSKKVNECNRPLHLLLAHQQHLEKELSRAESVLQKLGNMAALVNQMTVQGLVTITQQDVTAFLNKVLKRGKSQQCCLFQADLILSADGQLTVDPPMHLFQEVVSEALLTVGDAVIQMSDTCGFFLETNNCGTSSTFSSGSAKDLTPDLSLASYTELSTTGENKDNVDGMTGLRRREPRDESARWLLPPKLDSVMVQGHRLPGCYYPLSKRQLEWQLSINHVSEQAEREQARIMQEAQTEIQQLCDRYASLVDIHRFTSQWNPASLESMKGQPALLYDDLIKKLHQWSERIRTMPPSFSTSNRLFIIHCGHIQEDLGLRLMSIEEDALKHLVEQMKLHSDKLISDLKTATAALKTQPPDCYEFAKYTSMVKWCEKTAMQQRLEYIRSLQDSICKNYRMMTEQEVTLEEQVCRPKSEEIVRQRLPSMSDALDQTFSSLVCDLDQTVSNATSGPFLDPTQNAKEMFSTLNLMCSQVYAVSAKLKELSRTSEKLTGHPLDLTIAKTAIQKIEARKELWELMTLYTTWIQEWRQSVFSKSVVSQAQEKVDAWQEQAVSLARILPTHDAVLQETLSTLDRANHQLAVMAKLCSPVLKHKHWRNIFQGMGQLYVPEMKLTVAELMSKQLGEHQKHIDTICREAKAEWDMEQTFQKLQQGWEAKLFQLDKFTVPVSNHQTTRQHSSDGATLTITEELLDIFERYQQTWAFLTKMLYETTGSIQRVELLERFHPVDETFREIIYSISSDSHVLNMVRSQKRNEPFHGKSFWLILTEGLSTMEAITNQMLSLLDVPRGEFPRLCFMSDREVMKLLSLCPAPSTLLPFVRKCFKGVLWLEVDCESPSDTTDLNRCGEMSDTQKQMKVLGVFGSLQEHIAFLCPVEPNSNPCIWLCVLEKQLQKTMMHLMKQCAVVRKQLEPLDQDLECDKKFGDRLLLNAKGRKAVLPVLNLLSDYPLQCLLVVEEEVWCSEVLNAYQASSPVKWSHLKTNNSAKLKSLCHAIRDGLTGANGKPLVSNRMMMGLRALVQLTMNHAQQLSRLMEVQCDLESSFEWLSLMKYHTTSESLNDSDHATCYVDVLGYRLSYGYEYFGPEDWMMVNTPSTDRVILGILLALTSYRCGFVSGPCMSGKRKTVIQLGRALGRQVIALQCCLSMRPGLVQQMLVGALQTGAWLLLDSVDLLTPGVLSLLGQHLVDIQQALSVLKINKEERVYEEPKDRTSDLSKGCKSIGEPQCQILFGGRSIFANLGYGCVVISSKGYTTEIPESLRAATRPIALTHPEYRIIAEVMLASLGFSEAMPLSQCLVSLFSLAKDSLCLPEFINEDQTSWLVVLRNVITACGTHLEQSIRQRDNSKEEKVSAEESKSHKSPHKVTEEGDEDKGAKVKITVPSSFMHSPQSAAIAQAVMEEKAMVKALLSVLLPATQECKKASQLHNILKETFPMAWQFPLPQQYIHEEEHNLLKGAVTEELQRAGFHFNTQTIHNVLTLYQAMKFSPAVLLVGPSGSGKTTCYDVLARTLRTLAARATEDVFDQDDTTKGDNPQAQPQISVSTWSSVDTVVLFPNAMSHEEFFGGFCEERGWQDGVFTKVLRDSEWRGLLTTAISSDERNTNLTQKVKWLVMDGEPLGQPGWLDCFTTLCRPEDPSLCLSSGEKLVPSQSELKLLAEITDLSDATPSAVTRCSLVYFTGTDLWKSVWKGEMDALYKEHRLDQGTVRMWNRLAEDLFASTLSLLSHKALTSAMHNEGNGTSKYCKSPIYGLHEVLSFIRILHSLLEHFGKGVGAKATGQTDTRGIITYSLTCTLVKVVTNKFNNFNNLPTDGPHEDHTQQELQARNIFLVAYIWGFGGHLHPRHWPQFDLLVRQVLYNSRYKIEVSGEGSVFEHFFSQNDDINQMKCPGSKITQLTKPTIPKYEKYRYLLELMLEANQPVMLAGEAASGKTTLCKTLLNHCRPHISVPASPLLSSHHLCNVLDNISCHTTCTLGAMTKQSRLLLFVDDLHEAPCDAFGKTSRALEALRQSISKGRILTSETYMFKLLSCETISYMATCRTFGSGNHGSNVISSRLSRLFSIFVLPSLSVEVLFSIHSPQLKLWLKDIPFVLSYADMACCIITATQNLYHAVREQFQPTVQRPHYVFSHHDLQKVFQGMCLWQPHNPNRQPFQKNDSPATVLSKSAPTCFAPAMPGPSASVLNIARLWMHECLRTFSDRLCSEEENKTLVSLIAKVSTTYYGSRLVNEPQPASLEGPPTATSSTTSTLPTEAAGTYKSAKPKPSGRSDRKMGHKLTEQSLQTESNDSEEPSIATPLPPLQLLQHMEETMDKIVYGPELSEPVSSLDRQHNFQHSSSYQEQDFDLLVRQLSATVKGKEEDEEQGFDNNYSVTFSCILHRERVRQLLHILRTLLIPGGHGILFGSVKGTGRKTAVRLAAYLMNHQLIEVHPGNERKLREILKEAGSQARFNGSNIVILAHEEISQAVREELLVAMAHGTCPGLYSHEELTTLFPNSRRGHMEDHMLLEKYFSQFHRNVHVFLLLPFTISDSSEIPADSTQGWNAYMTKALSLSCCVEVYPAWSSQSLVEAAAHCFKANPHKPDSNIVEREELEASMSLAMAGIHQSACRYASVLLRTQPFSPQTYLEFITHFFYLCNHLHKQGLGQANRVVTVLACLDGMTNTAVQYKHDLDRLQDQVEETQQCEKELLRAVDVERSLLQETRQRCVVEENRLCQLDEQIQHFQQQACPLFLSGLQILECLSPSDLEEVRHYRNPPDGVVKIMEAICLLFNRPPSWESAKQLLGQSNVFQEFEFFDHNGLTHHQLQQLGLIVHSPQFVPESVREVSRACESLCRWVRAVYDHTCMEHHTFSQENSKRHLEALAVKAHGRLRLARLQEEELVQRLGHVQLQLQFVQKDLEELLMELHRAESLERQAAAAVSQMEKHVTVWKAAAQEAELNNQTIPGDALILAATISYLGPFGPDIRTELLSKWRTLCQTGSININPEDPRTSLFPHTDPAPPDPPLAVPIPVSEKLHSALARTVGIDQWQVQDLTARLVVKLLLWGYRRPWVQQWPLLVDTQHHEDITCQRWHITGDNTKLGKEEYGMVVSADDPQLLEKLDQAAEKGFRVLVTHMERAEPRPQFLAMLVRSAGSFLPGFKPSLQPTHPNFCLFLSTHLPVQLLSSAVHPSILAEVRVVDLSLSSAEIQEVMLTQLLQSEWQELLTQHSLVHNDKQALQEKLVKEEASLMDSILQTITPLHQDSDFLDHMVACQEAIENLQAEIQQLSVEIERNEALLSGPRGISRLAAALYRALQDTARLSPGYFFSLHGFIMVMRRAFGLKVRPEVSYTDGKIPRSIISEITYRMVAHLLARYRPCLFQSHATLLKLLVSVAVLQHNKLCSEAERAVFLRGLPDLDFPSPPSSPPATSQHVLPSWIPAHIHPELFLLDKMAVFRGLVASLSTSPKQWQEYLRFPSSTVGGAVPCRSHSHLSLLQRALLWKTMLPHCLGRVAEDMAACHLGLSVQTGGAEALHPGNPEALSRFLVQHEGPVILTLPGPGRERWTSIQPLHLIQQLSRYQADEKEKVISLGASCERDVVLSVLDKAVSDGHWLVFNNCHLLEQWDDKVVVHLNQLTSSTKAAVRVCALPLVCDSSWDVKEELSCSLRQVASVVQPESLSDVQDSLRRCAVLHSVLLQRQAYTYLGPGNFYRWTQEDLLALVDTYIHIASLCQDKTKALEYIAVRLVHGSHVWDSADLQVVESVVKTCLSTELPLWGSGPHILTNTLSSPGHFGLLHRVQDLANISDPLVLGFSADLAAEIVQINSHTLNLLLRDSQAPLGDLRSSSTKTNHLAKLPDYNQTIGRLQTLKSHLAHEDDSAVRNAGGVSPSPLRDFLLAEWEDLMDWVSSLLSQLLQSSQRRTPTSASLLDLTDLSRLERRAELLSAYLGDATATDPPTAYRLSAFKNARGFLVAVMREAAQAKRKDLSHISLHFQVLSVSTIPTSLPLDGVYLSGLELRGALWDTQPGSLQDNPSPQPHLLPPLYVRARDSSTDTPATNTSKKTDSPSNQVAVYHCPLYLDAGRDGGDGALADADIITRVPLPAKISPVLCSLRRARLVSVL
ncbi:LOW QUALITY PROTEIN: dynein heavy chain domain-containing protein 1-like [Diretmus argenteus]